MNFTLQFILGGIFGVYVIAGPIVKIAQNFTSITGISRFHSAATNVSFSRAH